MVVVFSTGENHLNPSNNTTDEYSHPLLLVIRFYSYRILVVSAISFMYDFSSFALPLSIVVVLRVVYCIPNFLQTYGSTIMDTQMTLGPETAPTVKPRYKDILIPQKSILRTRLFLY